MGKEGDRFTREQVRLPEFLERATLQDMVPGSVGYVDNEELFVDIERRCWINGLAEFKGEQYAYDEQLTIIRLNEGYFVDLTSVDEQPKFLPGENSDELAEDPAVYLPVAGFIVSPKDLLDFDKQYREQTGHRYIEKSLRKKLKKRVELARVATRVTVRSAK